MFFLRSEQLKAEAAELKERIKHLNDMVFSQQRKVKAMIEEVKIYTDCSVHKENTMHKMSWRDYCNLIFLIIKQTNTFAGWNTESKISTEGYVHHRAAGQDCHCGVWGKSNCFHVASQMWFLHAPHLYQSKKHRLVGISMRNVTIPDSIAILSSGLFKVFFLSFRFLTHLN